MAATEADARRDENGEDKDEDLWSAILNDVATSSARNRTQVTKTLLVLGDVNSGKSTLIDRLCQVSKSHPIGGKFPLSGCSLEYRFIDVQDEETDDIVDRMGVWILDGVVWHSQLLSFVLTKSNIQDTTVMIVVDMSQPWTIMESLERWAEVVRKHIQTLQIPDKQLKNMQENLVKQFQSYIDPEESSGPVGGADEEGVALPLGETTLTCNIGIPIIVVCCKSDAVVDLEKTHGYTDEHLDFIQQAIRSFCLNYGAALFYVSSKEDKNLPVLHKYLVHRAYGMPFKEVAWVVDKDAVFIPSGWDNEKKISILYEHMKQFKPSQDYSSVIMTPKTTEFESEIGQQSAEEDQVFLMAMQAHMVRSPRPAAQQPSSGQAPSTKHSPRPSGDAGDPSAQTSGVLANFFNSLLSNKKQPGSRSGSTVRAAATVELDRLQNKS